jgi:hypothetical protein
VVTDCITIRIWMPEAKFGLNGVRPWVECVPAPDVWMDD